MNKKRLLIAHFYNEEYLLPFWIRHHFNLFDDVVLINNNSSDRLWKLYKQWHQIGKLLIRALKHLTQKQRMN